MNEADFYESTLHGFHLRLKGWQEAKEAERIEGWRRTRVIASWFINTTEWQKGKSPDIMRIMPLPGDPPPDDGLITITDEEMALRKYRAKKAHGFKFNDEFEELVRKHYRPEWGPHPDELTKPVKPA